METLLPNDFARGSRAYNPAATTTAGNVEIVQPPPPAGHWAYNPATIGHAVQAPPSPASHYAAMSDSHSVPVPPDSSIPNSTATSDNR